ncbi:MAG: hypothetical protein WBL25_13785 [Anaerolineales bacterium]
MNEQRFYQRPWFYIFLWTVIGGGFYFWQIRNLGGILTNLSIIIIDAVIFLIGLFVWLAFFAQFVLPVRTFAERQKIFDRLLVYLSGGHGPAIFIRDGKQIKREGEEKKKGPGVLWLDSASAAVTRSATSFKQTLGPGVHFTEKGEFIASSVDLHIQRHSIGPREEEEPFASKKEDQSEDEFKQIQKRRLEVSAWTRDGIEVVPNIKVIFKIDATPVTKDEDEGSRFGFDKEVVRKAVTGEGINPHAPSETPRHRVAWNQLPALIAADLWREYLSKFTLAELFEVSQPGPKPIPPAPGPEPVDTQALMEPVTPSSGLEKSLAGIFHELNIILARIGDRCERSEKKTVKHIAPAPKPEENESVPIEIKTETALQTINRMIKARLTKERVIILDDSGKPAHDLDEENTLISSEYELLKSRGIKVLSASVSNSRFPPHIEDQFVRQWSTTWLDSANAERGRIDRLRGFVELSGQVEAVLEYTKSLSRNLLRYRPSKQKDALKILMLRSRDELVKNDRLHRRASMEREELEELIQWVERNSQ